MVCCCCCARSALAETWKTRAATAIQSVAAGSVAEGHLLPGAHCGPVLPSRGWEGGCEIFLCHVRNRWHLCVSISKKYSSRRPSKTDLCSMILAALYWYVWTVLIPRWLGYT